jgi:hypothetical protein
MPDDHQDDSPDDHEKDHEHRPRDQGQDQAAPGEEGATPAGEPEASQEAPQELAEDTPPLRSMPPGPPVPPSISYSIYVPYLRAWRESRGFSREALAARTLEAGRPAISLYTLRHIENYGRPARPGTVTRLARALGLTVDDLLHLDPFTLPPTPPAP